MTEYTGNPLLWVALVALVAAAVLISRQRKAARALRQQVQGLRDHYTELENDYGKSVQAAQERAEDETKTVLKSAMRTLQGLAAEQQLVLSRLQNKYGDSALLQDLLEIDHTNSQFGRRAQSIAVLCDGWLGGRRDTASVYDVVRSAQGRIRHFRRVDILSQADFGITSRAVEPVALALAELLDNATSYSSPDTVVEINIRTVPKGICVVVDDAGVGMSDEERARADKLLATERASGVAGLGNPPQFGFAVIGLLCERFGFEVSVDSSSPYGGVRAVVLLPHELLTAMPEKKAPAPAPAAAPTPSRRRSWVPSSAERSPAGSPNRTARTTPAGRATHLVQAAKDMRSRERRSVMDARQRPGDSGRPARGPDIRRRPLDGPDAGLRQGRRGPGRGRHERCAVAQSHPGLLL